MSTLILILCFSIFASRAQIKEPAMENKCLDAVRKIVARNSDFKRFTFTDKKNYFLNYSVSVLSNFDKEPKVSDVIIYANNSRILFQADEAELYQDDKLQVSVLPGQKIIIVNERANDLKKFKDQQFKRMEMIQDTIFSVSKIRYCGTHSLDDGTITRRVSLALTGKAANEFKISSIDFVLDSSMEQFKNVTITYHQHPKLRRVEYQIKKFDENAKTDKLTKPVLSYVMKNSNTLLSKYNGYRLIDNRNSKK